MNDDEEEPEEVHFDKKLDLGETLPLPKVEEKEEILDDSKMEDIRMAMQHDIKDNLDCPELVEKVMTKFIQDSIALSKNKINILADLEERSRFIPMRLSSEERRLLNVAKGALDISSYTDKVDVSSNDYYARSASDKYETMREEQEALAQAIAGVAVCSDYKSLGKNILYNRDLPDNEELFYKTCEIGRRYKIMNPDKMRDTYGKLLYAIMDNIQPHVRRNCGFNLLEPIKTVQKIVTEYEVEELLKDPLLAIAASEVEKGTIDQVEQAQKEKKQANELLTSKYCNENKKLSQEDLKLIIASITDNASFLRSNRGPVDRLIYYLKKYFSPNALPSKPGESLQIRHGTGGSKLSHSHETQFYFVLQSLTLWREIMGNFFKLWYLAEEDLLDDRNGYRIANTGQGLQRLQCAPRVERCMSEILRTVKSKVGRWIGLSVVHLGDRDVPNALIFIDKYTQVPRILAPIVRTLDQIDELDNDPDIHKYIVDNFHNKESLRKSILSDFFKHGFDGSGDDGGSCIDGRLTSCWNWANRLEKKKFHSIFMLTNFQGFDGDFRDDD